MTYRVAVYHNTEPEPECRAGFICVGELFVGGDDYPPESVERGVDLILRSGIVPGGDEATGEVVRQNWVGSVLQQIKHRLGGVVRLRPVENFFPLNRHGREERSLRQMMSCNKYSEIYLKKKSWCEKTVKKCSNMHQF